MPNGPTTYPTIAATVRDCASHVQGFYPASADQLDAAADGIDAMATELARTRRELADTDAVAAALRAQNSDVAAAFNRQAIVLDRLIAYADKQPCMCSEHEVRANVADPCDRCLALGRVLDEPVDQ